MRVLIVEDNAGDAFMIEEMLNELKMELEDHDRRGRRRSDDPSAERTGQGFRTLSS